MIYFLQYIAILVCVLLVAATFMIIGAGIALTTVDYKISKRAIEETKDSDTYKKFLEMIENGKLN